MNVFTHAYKHNPSISTHVCECFLLPSLLLPKSLQMFTEKDQNLIPETLCTIPKKKKNEAGLKCKAKKRH